MRLTGLLSAGLFILTVLSSSASAQSTSPWVRVRPIPSTPISPALGASYVNIVFRGASVYQKSNWWTQLVQRNRRAVLDVSVDATVNNVPLRDTRVSNPIEIENNDSQLDFGYSGSLVSRLPTTYSSMRVTVGVSKTAEDGLEKLITSVADLSKTVPTLTVSQSALGVISATKQLADFMFDRQLLAKKLRSVVDFPATGGAMPAGLYVCIAGDNNAQYGQYFTNEGTDLAWNGAALTWKGQPVAKVSYFVVEVSYEDAVFTRPIDALSLPKPWSSLYELSRREVGKIASANDVDKAITEIRAHLSDAQTLLDADPDYIQDERDKIHEAIRFDTQSRLNARIGQFAAADAATAPTTPVTMPGQTQAPPPRKPLVLSIPDNILGRSIAKEIAKEHGTTAATAADSVRKLLSRPPR